LKLCNWNFCNFRSGYW